MLARTDTSDQTLDDLEHSTSSSAADEHIVGMYELIMLQRHADRKKKECRSIEISLPVAVYCYTDAT